MLEQASRGVEFCVVIVAALIQKFARIIATTYSTGALRGTAGVPGSGPMVSGVLRVGAGVRPVRVWGYSFWSVYLLTTPLPLSKHRTADCPRLPSLTVARSWRPRCLSFAIVDPERYIGGVEEWLTPEI